MSTAPTYTAHISPAEDGTITMLVTRDIPAGICGPFSEEVIVADTTDAEGQLTTWGYALVEPWTFASAYDGLRLSAELERTR